MTSTGTRKERNVQTRSNEAITEADKEFINGLKIFSESSNSVAGLAGPSVNNSPKTPAGNYLAREGDSMIGPIAFGPPLNFRVEVDANNTIDIGPLGENIQYSSNIQLDDLQPNSSVLDIIANAAFDGQILVLRTFAPTVPYNIRQATLANGGNIQTADGNDIVLSDLQMMILVFDESLIVFNNTGGTWRVLSTSGGGGTGTFVSADLSADQITNIAVGNHIEFDRNATPTGANGAIVLQTGAGQLDGIFELLAGKTYFLSGTARPLFSAANAVELVWYDITNATEIGRRCKFDDAVLAMNQPKCEIIYNAVTNVTVELRIVAVTTPANLTGFDADFSFAHIFEFSGVNQGAGAVSVLLSWKNPVRAKTLVDVGTLSSFVVLTDGVTLVENDRVLLTEQTTASENGIYDVGVVSTGVAPLTRSSDFDENSEVVSESFVAIEEGTLFKDQVWHLITNNPITVGTTAQVWKVFAPGTSGGPDLGGDEGGIDGAGEWVYDGRVASGNHITKKWEQGTNSTAADNGVNDVIYMPSNGNTASRLFALGDSNLTNPAAYSDDLGDSWTTSNLSANHNWVRSAYDPVGNILVSVNTDGTTTTIKNKSTDRGANFTNITSPNTDNHWDIIWSAADSLFVATAFSTPAAAGLIRGIQTSPTGTTWTARVTPTPAGTGFWKYVAYSPSQGLYVAITAGQTDVMTSTDAITWTLGVALITGGTELATILRLIYSPGQDKFVAVGNRRLASARELTSWTSKDGINWEEFNIDTFTTGVSAIQDVVWASDLSLYVAVGGTTATGFNSSTHYWVSNDAESWTRISRDVPALNSSTYQGITYAQEYGQFVAVTGTSNITIYRTFR